MDNNSLVHNGSYASGAVGKNVKNLVEKNIENVTLNYYIS